MEAHLVPKTVLEKLKAAEEHRNRYTADVIKKVTDEARTHRLCCCGEKIQGSASLCMAVV